MSHFIHESSWKAVGGSDIPPGRLTIFLANGTDDTLNFETNEVQAGDARFPANIEASSSAIANVWSTTMPGAASGAATWALANGARLQLRWDLPQYGKDRVELSLEGSDSYACAWQVGTNETNRISGIAVALNKLGG